MSASAVAPVFQALRIWVNDEMADLEGALIVPVSELNRLRRDLAEQLTKLRRQPPRWRHHIAVIDHLRFEDAPAARAVQHLEGGEIGFQIRIAIPAAIPSGMCLKAPTNSAWTMALFSSLKRVTRSTSRPVHCTRCRVIRAKQMW